LMTLPGVDPAAEDNYSICYSDDFEVVKFLVTLSPKNKNMQNMRAKNSFDTDEEDNELSAELRELIATANTTKVKITIKVKTYQDYDGQIKNASPTVEEIAKAMKSHFNIDPSEMQKPDTQMHLGVIRVTANPHARKLDGMKEIDVMIIAKENYEIVMEVGQLYKLHFHNFPPELASKELEAVDLILKRKVTQTYTLIKKFDRTGFFKHIVATFREIPEGILYQQSIHGIKIDWPKPLHPPEKIQRAKWLDRGGKIGRTGRTGYQSTRQTESEGYRFRDGISSGSRRNDKSQRREREDGWESVDRGRGYGERDRNYHARFGSRSDSRENRRRSYRKEKNKNVENDEWENPTKGIDSGDPKKDWQYGQFISESKESENEKQMVGIETQKPEEEIEIVLDDKSEEESEKLQKTEEKNVEAIETEPQKGE